MTEKKYDLPEFEYDIDNVDEENKDPKNGNK